MLCTKPTGRINVEVILEQWLPALQLPTKTSEMCWWDKYQGDQQSDLHMEGWDEGREGSTKGKDSITERGDQKNRKEITV